MKRLEKKLDRYYIRKLHAILNKSLKQHLIHQKLHGHLPPISQTIQVRQTKHVKNYWESIDEHISNILLWTPTQGHTSVGWPIKSYLYQLCVDTACSLENLSREMADRDGWWERVKGIYAISITWWWWQKKI